MDQELSPRPVKDLTPRALPLDPLNETDDFITVFDILAFVKRWAHLILILTALGGTLGLIYALTRPKAHESSFLFESSRFDPDVLKDSKAINLGLVAAFNRNQTAQVFSRDLYSEIKTLASKSGRDQAAAVKLLQFLVKSFGGKTTAADETALAQEVERGLTSYLRSANPAALPASKRSANFAFMTEFVDAGNYQVTIRQPIEGASTVMAAATIASLNHMISFYNQTEVDIQRQMRKRQVDQAKAVLDSVSLEYEVQKPLFEKERAQLTAETYALTNEITRLEKKANLTEKEGNFEKGILPQSINGNFVITDSAVIDAWESLKVRRRIARLASLGVGSAGEQELMTTKFSKIEVTRSSLDLKYGPIFRTFAAAQSRYFAARELEASKPSMNEFALPLTINESQTLDSATQAGYEPGTSTFKWGTVILGCVLGLVLALMLSIGLQFARIAKIEISKSRFA